MAVSDSPTVSSQTGTNIALCGDTHSWFGIDRYFGQFGEQLQPWSEEILQNLASQLRREAPAWILHLGDFTCGGGVFQMPDDAFHTALTRVHSTLSGLGSNFRGLPGNHDCPYGTGDYTICESMLGLPRRLGSTLDLPQARLILVNAQGHSKEQIQAALPEDPVYGWIAAEELARVEAELASGSDKPILLFIHQLLVPWQVDVPWKDYYQVRNAQDLLAIVARHPQVVAVFQAHAHLYDVQWVSLGGRERLFVAIPSLIQYPLGWLLLQLRPDGMSVELRRLALPELQERSRKRDPFGDARAGHPRWERFSVSFSPPVASGT